MARGSTTVLPGAATGSVITMDVFVPCGGIAALCVVTVITPYYSPACAPLALAVFGTQIVAVPILIWMMLADRRVISRCNGFR